MDEMLELVGERRSDLIVPRIDVEKDDVQVTLGAAISHPAT